MQVRASSRKASAEHDFGWRTDRYAWFVAILVTLCFACSMIDRMILVLLVKPIEAEFGLSDFKFSLLQGTAFVSLYVLMGFPLGRLADRYNRRNIAAFSVAGWSLMTALCAFAPNFPALFLARVGVGVGEAGLSPAALSLIADYFEPKKLSRPITFYSLGGSAGVGAALIGGGAMLDYFANHGTPHLPFFSETAPWRVIFLIVCLPGLVLTALLIAVKEPRRGGRTVNLAAPPSWTDVLGFLNKRRDFVAVHILGAGLTLMVSMGMQAWMPTFLIRTFGVTAAQVGTKYGLVVLVSGITGLIIAGPLADKLAAKGYADSHIRVVLGASLLAILPAILAPLMPTFNSAVAMSALANFCLASAMALSIVALQILTPNQMRGQMIAIYMLVYSVLGYAVGPALIAFVAEHFLGGKAFIGHAIALVTSVGAPLATLCYTVSRKHYLRYIEPDLCHAM